MAEKTSSTLQSVIKNPSNGQTYPTHRWRDKNGNVPFGISGSHGSCEDLCNRCKDTAGETCLGFSVNGDRCFFRNKLNDFKNYEYFFCSKKIPATDSSTLSLGESGPVQETNWRFSSNITLDAFLACAIFAIGFAANTASRSIRLRSINMKNELEAEQNTPICTSERASYGSVL